jgi:type I restriction enzyme M protein
MSGVVFLNPRTCGIYKDGGTRYKTDPATGRRTDQVDNELIEHVNDYIEGKLPNGAAVTDVEMTLDRQVLVPTYYDERHNRLIHKLLKDEGLQSTTLGELIDAGSITVRGGHGSPGNDQRTGHIPYVKVSDIRGVRININPTNLVSESVARRFWRGASSGLLAWDLITPNRASSNIGEFAILLPGEEEIVVTKEVFVLRVADARLFDHFYLLWALSLKAVREQWRRVALMQTNREDCGDRYREVLIPKPKDKAWADKASAAFRSYFTTIADAKAEFADKVRGSKFEHVANVASALACDVSPEGEEDAAEAIPAPDKQESSSVDD